jgi:RNA polymerase sigma-70 factor (ECF subfamily)
MDGDGFGDVERDTPVVAARESFEGFFRREYRQVLGLAIVLCRNRAVAEELTMEAFEAALREWPKVSNLEAPGAWVRRVVSNSSVSWYRRLSAEGRALIRLSGDQPRHSADAQSSASVWSAVRHLPRRQAQVIALFYVAGYGRRQIAEMLGISEESVKTHLERGRRRLKKELGHGRDG